MDLGTRLRHVRKTHRMTLSDVSQKTGISVSFLSGLERGRDKPSLDTLEKLALNYQMSTASLLGESMVQNGNGKGRKEPPGYREFLERMGDNVTDDLRELMIFVDHKARKPAQSMDDWMRYYYVLSPLVA